ncbi:MAG: hypothetical protein RJQ07_13455 [Pseudomonadales bacterium]
MTGFRILLVVILSAVTLYTLPVIVNHGVNLFPTFFGDMLKMGWAGQFNLDFLGFLILSAFWTAWRNEFSPSGLGLAVLAFFFGAPFLTIYLLYLSFQTNHDAKIMLLGAQRAST